MRFHTSPALVASLCAASILAGVPPVETATVHNDKVAAVDVTLKPGETESLSGARASVTVYFTGGALEVDAGRGQARRRKGRARRRGLSGGAGEDHRETPARPRFTLRASSLLERGGPRLGDRRGSPRTTRSCWRINSRGCTRSGSLPGPRSRSTGITTGSSSAFPRPR